MDTPVRATPDIPTSTHLLSAGLLKIFVKQAYADVIRQKIWYCIMEVVIFTPVIR